MRYSPVSNSTDAVGSNPSSTLADATPSSPADTTLSSVTTSAEAASARGSPSPVYCLSSTLDFSTIPESATVSCFIPEIAGSASLLSLSNSALRSILGSTSPISSVSRFFLPASTSSRFLLSPS
ncbi:hypothetical protein ANAPC1_00777 [Anaplasma phagocytophilum]|uniref:Uncharacterized protein n=1 Tax=Anaplasma phagocytophilum TaxID=948 RepID=A0AA45UT06_ANAPH|nr:hypothetical protein ANAPC1_00777 [Anaplasma phagocytophilum]SBO31900.1 hypothetical protein ANAPC2_00837 [Anaplasma phagocytophilum]SBO32083.1 hypothetical protein ANAPC3_00743 [Anaplasma phagocytophilum]